MNDMASSEKKETDSIKSSKLKARGCVSCLEYFSKKLKLVEDGATPPNWKYIGLVFLALFSSSSTLTFLLPFLPEMMLTLGYDETEKGKYVGIIASAVFAGRIVGSLFWGYLADRYGRKIVLLITIALNGLFAGLFGFAKNLVMAFIFRFLCGAANGTVGTAKTILYDISDNTNQAFGMSMLSIAWGMGMIVGPAVGGILASPAVKWPHVFSPDGFFGEYPYLLASLFPFVNCVLIFIYIFFKFDETFVVKSSKREKQELIIADEENENNVAVKDSLHPLLGNMTRKSQSSLSQICQSMHSVHTEAESAAYMALLSEQPKKSVDVKHLPVHRTQSVPDINSSETTFDCSKVSYSIPNIYDGYQHREDKKITSEGSDNPDESGFLSNLPNEDLRAKGDNNREMIHSHGGLNESENQTGKTNLSHIASGACFVDNKDEKYQEKINGKMEYSIVDYQKTNESTPAVVIVELNEENEKTCRCVERLCICACFQKTSLYKLLRLSDVWATVVIYTMFSMIAIAVDDIFPVFASTEHDYDKLYKIT